MVCDDEDFMIIFSDACWVRNKDENPQEKSLPFPVEIYENSGSDYDFQGGAGSTFVENKSYSKVNKKSAEDECAEAEMEAQSPAREEEMKKPLDVTPVRHSERTAGKKFKFAIDASSPDAFPQDDSLDVEMKDSFCEVTPTQDGEIEPQLPKSAVSGSSSRKSSQNGNGRLVQATISTLLKKANKKAKQSSSVKKTVPSAEKAGSQSDKKKKIERKFSRKRHHDTADESSDREDREESKRSHRHGSDGKKSKDTDGESRHIWHSKDHRDSRRSRGNEELEDGELD